MARLLLRFVISLFVGVISTTTIAGEERLSVTFVIPDKEGPLFWRMVKEVSVSVSQSLDIDFNYVHSDSDRFAGERVIKEVLSYKKKPDYLIFRPFFGSAHRTFSILESNEIRFITIEKAFSGNEANKLGKPRQKFKHWLGQINYDDKKGGELLLEALLAEKNNKFPDALPKIVAIGGDFDSVSINRQSALQEMVGTPSLL